MPIGVYLATVPKRPSFVGFVIGLVNKSSVKHLISLLPNSTFFPGKEGKHLNDLTP